MNHLETGSLNLNNFKDRIDNHLTMETNINYDYEDSYISLPFEHSLSCIPHLFEKFNCLKPEISDKNKEFLDDKNNIVNNKGKSSKRMGDEPLDTKTIFVKKKNKCGRKRKGENYDINNDEHDKFSDDNVRRRVKRIIFTHLLKYINKQIQIKYNGEIGKGILKKELYVLNQAQIINSSASFNQALLNKTLYDIFSDKISSRITNYPEDHNKVIIEGLLNEKDTEKSLYFKNLFNLTFSDCLEYLSGAKHFEQLNGLELFSEFKEIKQDYLKKYNDGEKYVKLLKYYMKEFKNIINNKNPRELIKERNKKKKI